MDNEFTLSENPFPELNIPLGPYRCGKNLARDKNIRIAQERWDRQVGKVQAKNPKLTWNEANETAKNHSSSFRAENQLSKAFSDSNAFLKDVEDAHLYRLGHPLAQKIIEKCKALALDNTALEFNYSHSGKRISVIEPLLGKSGFMSVVCHAVTALETEDFISLSGVCDDGTPVDPEQCRRFFSLGAVEKSSHYATVPQLLQPQLDDGLRNQQNEIAARLTERNGAFFEIEMDKLDRWTDDHRRSLKSTLDELDVTIKEARNQARKAPNLPTKLEFQRHVRQLEDKRNAAWREYDQAAQAVELKKDALLDEISQRLHQQTEQQQLFVIRWQLR